MILERAIKADSGNQLKGSESVICENSENKGTRAQFRICMFL